MPSLNARMAAAQAVAAPLLNMEQQIDAAITSYTQVMAAAIAARRDVRLPLHAGQEGLEELSSAIGQLVAARKSVHTAHYVFRAISDEMRVPVQAFGDHGDTPDQEFYGASRGEVARPALAVASAA